MGPASDRPDRSASRFAASSQRARPIAGVGRRERGRPPTSARWSRKRSHSGIAESPGAPSSGMPGPPLAMRQKKNVSWKFGSTPESMEVRRHGAQRRRRTCRRRRARRRGRRSNCCSRCAGRSRRAARTPRDRSSRARGSGFSPRDEIDLLAVDGDLRRRRRVHRAAEERRLDRLLRARVDAPGDERRGSRAATSGERQRVATLGGERRGAARRTFCAGARGSTSRRRSSASVDDRQVDVHAPKSGIGVTKP